MPLSGGRCQQTELSRAVGTDDARQMGPVDKIHGGVMVRASRHEHTTSFAATHHFLPLLVCFFCPLLPLLSFELVARFLSFFVLRPLPPRPRLLGTQCRRAVEWGHLLLPALDPSPRSRFSSHRLVRPHQVPRRSPLPPPLLPNDDDSPGSPCFFPLPSRAPPTPKAQAWPAHLRSICLLTIPSAPTRCCLPFSVSLGSSSPGSFLLPFQVLWRHVKCRMFSPRPRT
jgi:hypothetical protein